MANRNIRIPRVFDLPNGHLLYCYQNFVGINEIMRDVELIIEQSNERVYLFGGCHGYGDGRNWYTCENSGEIRPSARLLRNDLAEELSRRVRLLRTDYPRSRVTFVNARNCTGQRFLDMLLSGLGHVVIGFCCSSDDMLVQQALQQLPDV